MIRQELVRLNYDVTETDVDQAIDNIVRQYALPSAGRSATRSKTALRPNGGTSTAKS